MENCIPIWKPIGLTPLEVIDIFRTQYVHGSKTISYAGRLDPMAEGVLLLLIGDENKKRSHYENLEKLYEVEILFGISSDTYDVMGEICEVSTVMPSASQVKSVLSTFLGKRNQEYPPFSSKTVNGKPLYWWARNKKLKEIEIPSREIEVRGIDVVKSDVIKVTDIKEKLVIIGSVKGDFRQATIVAGWNAFLKQHEQEKFLRVEIRVQASSGTYMRSLAHNIGKKLGCPALAYSIKRTRVGEFGIENCVKIS